MRPKNFKEVIAASDHIFTIGVAGDSGSGKTTFTGAVRHIFGDELVSTITLDDYHIYDRECRREMQITPLDPEANDLGRLEDDLENLKQGRAIKKMVYNHDTGILEGPVTFKPKKIVILEGLHTFYTPRLRENLDFMLFVDPAPEVKREWKLLRDMEKRGYERAEVIMEMEARECDYSEYIAPQRRFADAIIRIQFSQYGKDAGFRHNIYQVTLYQIKLEQRIRDVDLNIDLFSLLSFSDRQFLLEFGIEEIDGRKMGALTFDGELAYHTIRKLELNVEQQTGVHPIAMYEHLDTVNATDIVQLILAWRIINRRIFIEQNAQMRKKGYIRTVGTGKEEQRI